MKNSRYRQADREALITLGVYVFFFLWWTISAFGLGSGDPEEYSSILGMPSWFFFSCILGYPVVTVLLWVLIKKTFSDMPLEAVPASKTQEALGDCAAQSSPGAGGAASSVKESR